MARYRIVEKGVCQFEPQIWRWYKSFWVPLFGCPDPHTYGFWRSKEYNTLKEAQAAVDNYRNPPKAEYPVIHKCP